MVNEPRRLCVEPVKLEDESLVDAGFPYAQRHRYSSVLLINQKHVPGGEDGRIHGLRVAHVARLVSEFRQHSVVLSSPLMVTQIEKQVEFLVYPNLLRVVAELPVRPEDTKLRERLHDPIRRQNWINRYDSHHSYQGEGDELQLVIYHAASTLQPLFVLIQRAQNTLEP